MDATFVNPYTFVPFPKIRNEQGFRRPPAGHDRLHADRYQGRLVVELRAVSPLLVRGITDQSGDKEESGAVSRFPRRVAPGGGGGVPFLPGSSLAGVFRGQHELIVGGCLRIHDRSFRPAYRQPVKPLDVHRWRMALVEDIRSDGRPSRVRLCTEVVRVSAQALADAFGVDNVVTGMRLDLSKAVSQLPSDRRGGLRGVITSGLKQAENDSDVWVLLVTGRPGKQSVSFAAGKLGGDEAVLADTPDMPLIGDETWKRYRGTVAGSDDMRRWRGDRGPAITSLRDVERPAMMHGGPKLGVRHAALDRMVRGQVLWVTLSHRQISDITLAQVWRHTPDTPNAGQRSPALFRACPADGGDGGLELCPTCRIFGAADTDRADRGQAADQRAYRGHVRFSDALPVDATQLSFTERELPPLGTPKPGAGQFYLDKPEKIPQDYREHSRGKEPPPIGEWGSPVDRRAPRQLRGRKRYWLSGEYRDRPLFRLAPGESFAARADGSRNAMASRAETLDAGAVFRFTVTFENLSEAEIGGLIAALEPSSVLSDQVRGVDEATVGVAVGGGQPLGFGVTLTRVSDLHVADAAGRYLGRDTHRRVTRASALGAFKAQVDEGIRKRWPAVAAAAHLDHVPAGKIWYPTEAALPDSGELSAQQLAAGFDFWAKSKGPARDPSSFTALPRVTDTTENQELELPQRRGEQPHHRSQSPGYDRDREADR